MTSGYVIWAFSAYAKRVGKVEPEDLQIKEVSSDGKEKTLEFDVGLFPTVNFSESTSKIIFASKTKTPMFYQVTQAGFDYDLPTKPLKNKLEIQREYQNDGGKVITKINLGAEIEVHLKVRTIKQNRPQSVVVVDLFPGGFELVQGSIKERQSSSMAWTPILCRCP